MELDSVAHVPSQCRFNLKAHHTEINSVCYSDTDPLVYTGSSDGTVKAGTSTGHCQSTLRTIGGGGGGLIGIGVLGNLSFGSSGGGVGGGSVGGGLVGRAGHGDGGGNASCGILCVETCVCSGWCD